MSAEHDWFEQIRQAHHPATVSTLFVGESPPANGTFFYLGNSNLSRYTEEAFAVVYGPYADPQAFLADFRVRGCYLIDLCAEPINHGTRAHRRKAHREGIPDLTAALQELRPARIVVVMKGIADAVMEAHAQAGLSDTPLAFLPFPAQGNQRQYVAQLTALLKTL